MTVADWIVLAVILLAVGGAVAYIVNAKKKGQKCIGCPDCAVCSAKKKGSCGKG